MTQEDPRQVVLVHQVREELYRLLRPVALGRITSARRTTSSRIGTATSRVTLKDGDAFAAR